MCKQRRGNQQYNETGRDKTVTHVFFANEMKIYFSLKICLTKTN